MGMMAILGMLAFFGALVLFFATSADYLLQRRHIVRSMRTLKSIEIEPQRVRERELAAPLRRRVLIPGARRFGRLMRRVTPVGVVERLRKQIQYAGSPAGWDAERIAASKVVTAAVLGIGSFLLFSAAGTRPIKTIILTVLLTFAGYNLPDWLLRSRSAKRQADIQAALADTLDLLSITVEAGLGLDAAISRISRQEGGALGEELYRMVQEMQLGKNRADAFRDLADRSPAPELKSFALAMVQADVFGISISRVLQVQSKEMRLKKRQRAEERAQKIPVKIVFPLLMCIFPAIFVVLLGPAAIQIMEGLSSIK